MRSPRRPELFAAITRFARCLGWVWALLFCVRGMVAAHGQSASDGAIYAVVLDPIGRETNGLRVSLRAADGPAEVGTTRSAAARADGTLLFEDVPAGSYILTIGARVSAPFEVDPGGTTRLQVELGFGGMSTLVSAPPPAAEAANLPDQDEDGLKSQRGLASTQGRTLLDGMEQTQAFSGVRVGAGSDPAPDPDGDADSAEVSTGPANGLSRGRHAGVAYVFSQAAVKEFRVSPQSYSAQVGGAGGGALTLVSRGGGESLHGSGFFVVRSQLFAATSPLAIATSYSDGAIQSGPVKPHDLQERFGGSVGGPVPRTAMRWFYSFDGQRRGFPAVSSPADPAFYSLTGVQRALLANRGVSAGKVNAALNYVSSLTGLTDRRADQSVNFARVDWHPGRQGVALEYNRVRWSSPAGLIDAPVVARGRASLGNALGSLDAAIVRVSTALGAHVTNQVRVEWVTDVQYETPQAPLAQEPAIAPGGLAPEVNIGPNGLLFGTPATLSQQAFPDERRIELGDTVTVQRGRHLLAFGGQGSLVRDKVATLANAAGTFRYDSGETRGYAGGLVDFITDSTYSVNAYPNGGCPSIYAATHLFCFRSFSQSFGESAVQFSTRDWAGFAEDSWRPGRTLTLQAGARYEYVQLPTPTHANPALDAVFGVRAATGSFPEDHNNVGPRASVAWEPLGEGRGTLRLGYGVFFGRVPGATVRAALADTGIATGAAGGGTSSVRIRPNASVPCPQVQQQGFGYPCTFLVQPTGVIAATTSAVVFDRRFRLPAVQQGSLSLERRLGRGSSLSATYLMNLDRQLPTSTDLNIAPSTGNAMYQLQGGTGAPGIVSGEMFVLPVYTARVTTAFGPVTDLVSNSNASYHGLIVAAHSRVGESLLVRASYAWSKAIDDGQNLSGVPRTNAQLDPFRNGYDKGLSALNYPWSLHAEAVWSPRLGHPERWLQVLGDGWQLEPVIIARAGRPYSFDLSGGTYLAGGHESLNGSGGALYLPTVGRNTLRLPAAAKLDLRLQREVSAGARARLQLVAEAFNLTNHRSVSSVSQRAFLVGTAVNGVIPLVFQDAATIASEGLNTQPFGTPTAAASESVRERQVQLSLRVSF